MVASSDNAGIDAILTARRISKRFDGVQALKDAQFTLRPGEIHALMGENGAGKSTLGKILAGVLTPDEGELTIAQEPFVPANPQHAQRAGLAMIFQELDLFPELSVAENMAIGNFACAESGWVRRRRLHDFCEPFLAMVGLEVPPDTRVGRLPIGQQQLVAIARALSMDARILVMDEATSALTEAAADTLFALLARLKARGVSIIYVSHKMEEIFRVCDRATVLRDGAFIGTRELSETSMDELIQMMVGRSLDRRQRNRRFARSGELFTMNAVSTNVLRDVSFRVHAGEVVGLAGLVGGGRTEVGRALFGLDELRSGSMTLNSQPYHARNPRHAMQRSIGFVPEDRKAMGLMAQMGVCENMSLATLYSKQRAGFVRTELERDAFLALQDQTRLKAASARHPVSSLSGGNQQKVLLGRWLMLNPDLLFLDDPTRGVDVGAKEDIYALIESVASEGKGVLMVSSELPELFRCCDRILVMNAGRMVADLKTDETSQEEILHFAARQRETA